MSNIIESRIQYKYDTPENWDKSTFITLAGEMYIYAAENADVPPRIKFGDGKNKLKDIPFTTYDIKKTKTSKPEVTASEFTYDGNIKYVFENIEFNTTEIFIWGNITEVNPGEYTAYMSPAYGFCWEDGTTDIIEVNWTIKKADGYIHLETNNIEILAENGYCAVITFDSHPNSDVSCGKIEDIRVIVDNVNKTITLIPLKGNIECWVHVRNGDTDTHYWAIADIHVKVEAFPDTVFNNNNWDLISRVSRGGTASSWWNVGDVKYIDIDSEFFDSASLSSGTSQVGVFIIGFDHNAAIEGSGISLQGFKSSTAELSDLTFAYCDNQYRRSSVINTTNKYLTMMHWASTTEYRWPWCGWQGSDMRLYNLGSVDHEVTDITDSNPHDDNFIKDIDKLPKYSLMRALPEEFRNVLKQMNKYTQAYYSTDRNTCMCKDYIVLPSVKEIGKTSSISYKQDESNQETYEYYINGNTHIKYQLKHNAQWDRTTKIDYWLRSPVDWNSIASSTHGFLAMSYTEWIEAYEIENTTCWGTSLGISPIFLV